MTPQEESRHLRKFASKITKVPKEIKPTPIEYFIDGVPE